MTTTLLEKPQTVIKRERTWTELQPHQLPEGAIRVPLMIRERQKVKMPFGCTTQLATNPPATVWPRIMEAFKDFGLYSLYIYAPEKAFRQKTDPAIIAEKAGRFYLIAVWD